ncbi:MAG TPA: DUF5615 family PIN-like protein [Pyrinomonadaceae bacterium]|nr:DUF5615 family PIN-like protein [Pyrinomonadaceae bacterium]
MSVGLHTDVQFPLAITEQLRRRGVDVVTAQEDGARRFSDSDLLDRASQLGRVLVTQDKDLLVEGSLRQRIAGGFVGVIYVPQIGLTIGKCVEDLELMAQVTEPEEWINRVEYLPLK